MVLVNSLKNYLKNYILFKINSFLKSYLLKKKIAKLHSEYLKKEKINNYTYSEYEVYKLITKNLHKRTLLINKDTDLKIFYVGTNHFKSFYYQSLENLE